MERILALPKSGGVLHLLPIFAGLSVINSLAGGAACVTDWQICIGTTTMEAIALSSKGRCLYWQPYKKGLGLYVRAYERQVKNC